MAKFKVFVDDSVSVSSLFGVFDKNAKKIETAFNVKLSNNQHDSNEGDLIFIDGEDDSHVKLAVQAIGHMKNLISAGNILEDQTVDYIIDMITDGHENELDHIWDGAVCITTKGKPIKPRTIGQKKYVDSIRKNTVILGVGPAGTGKTFLAVAMAVDALRNRQVSRIILTRPAVEAGERLGFLPGDLQSKIDPYLRPLYDALFEMLGPENYARYIEKNIIEIAPLAYMRGRTLDDSFIILDEAQNTTQEQMKMFLTRLGQNSKAVVTGDPSQTDLPFGKKSGLGIAVKILKNIDGIAVHNFTERDVVRHRLVQKIISAYDKYDRENVQRSAEYNSFKVKQTGNWRSQNDKN